MLEDISGKIDILTLTDNSEWIEDIKNTLQNLNTSEISGEPNKEIQEMLKLISQKLIFWHLQTITNLLKMLEIQLKPQKKLKKH